MFTEGFYYYACLKDYDTAAKYLEQAYRLLPNDSRIPQALAYVERRRGNWDKSDAYFNCLACVRHRPKQLKYASLLSQLPRLRSYICLRRFHEALGKLEQI